MVFDIRVYYSPRSRHLNKPLSFCTRTRLRSLDFVATEAEHVFQLHNEGHRSDCLPFTCPSLLGKFGLNSHLMMVLPHSQWSTIFNNTVLILRLPRNEASQNCETMLSNQKVGPPVHPSDCLMTRRGKREQNGAPQ